MDNKIHNKEQLGNLLDNNIPIIAEIPFVKNISSLNSHLVTFSNFRKVLGCISNLRYTSFDSDSNSKKSQTIVFTSSIRVKEKP